MELPGGIRPRLSGPQERQLVNAVLKRYRGLTSAGEPIILDGMIEEVKRLSLNPSEMDWLSSEKSTRARITQGFGTNPIILGELEGANRASATAADKHFTDWTINPKIELLSQVLTEWLGRMWGDENLVIWIEKCIPNDSEMQYKWAELLCRHGVILAQELRALSPFNLVENDSFDGMIVGGHNMQTSGAIEAGIRQMILDQQAELAADSVLDDVKGSNRGYSPRTPFYSGSAST